VILGQQHAKRLQVAIRFGRRWRLGRGGAATVVVLQRAAAGERQDHPEQTAAPGLRLRADLAGITRLLLHLGVLRTGAHYGRFRGTGGMPAHQMEWRNNPMRRMV